MLMSSLHQNYAIISNEEIMAEQALPGSKGAREGEGWGGDRGEK
jgi:hypothetical protein